jgi:hypothetical protein
MPADDPQSLPEVYDESEHHEPSEPEAVRTTEAYECDEGVVLYDAENPLAWVQAETAVRLEEAA